MKNLAIFNSAFIFGLGLITSNSYAANVTQINRYATVENKPLKAQINPLLTVQQIHFPQDIKTVGAAMDYWLQYSGFSLAKPENLPIALKELLVQPLPQVDRNFGPLTIQDGLSVLVGQEVFALVSDPLHREINFKLKPHYAQVKRKGNKA